MSSTHTESRPEESVLERTTEKRKEAAEQGPEKAKEADGQTRDYLSRQLNERSTQAGQQASSLSDSLSRLGSQLRDEGQAKMAEGAAERVRRLSSYLQGTETSHVASGEGGAEPEIEVESTSERAVVLRLLGEHDLASANSLTAAFAPLLESGRSIVLDVRSAQFIDCSIIHRIFRARADATARSLGFSLCLCSDSIVQRPLELTGALDEIPHADTVARAVALADPN